MKTDEKYYRSWSFFLFHNDDWALFLHPEISLPKKLFARGCLFSEDGLLEIVSNNNVIMLNLKNDFKIKIQTGLSE